MGEILSGRPGSNRPPRPWQGRALPNELLPLLQQFKEQSILGSNENCTFSCQLCKELYGVAKIGIETIATKKIYYFGAVYFGVYNVLS